MLPQEERREIVPAAGVEVHREERDVGGTVDASEGAVEFDAVQDQRPAAFERDLGRAEVAVDLTDPAVFDACP
jgi:hypothetical protein